MSEHTGREDNGRNVLLKLTDQLFGLNRDVKRAVLWFLFSIVLGTIILLLPPLPGLKAEGQRFLALLVIVLSLWITEAIPIGVTALLVGGGLIAFSVQSPAKAWEPYANASVMYVLMIVMFGVIIEQVGLAWRILYFIVKRAGTNVRNMSLILAVSATLLSTLFHDATITIIFLYSILPVFQAMGVTPRNSTRLAKFFVILIPLAASAGGFGTYLGGGRNPVTVDILEQMTGIHIGFTQFLVYNLPLALFTGFVTWGVVWLVLKPEEKELPGGLTMAKLPPVSRNEKIVAFIFLIAFILWGVTDLTNIQVSVVAAVLIGLLFLLKAVDWKETVLKFPWESWLVFGAGVSMGTAMLDSGAGLWFANLMLPVFQHGPWPLLFLGTGLMGAVLTSLMSNTAAAALMLPITIPLAQKLGLDPAPIAMMAPISASFIMLVIGCPPTIIAYATGYFKQWEFVKVAIPWAVACVVVTTLIAAIYWPLIGFGDLPLLGYFRIR